MKRKIFQTENILCKVHLFESNNWHSKQISEQLSTKETIKRIIKKVTQSIYDEIKTPLELIKKYADLLMQKSSSAEANKVLQKIIDQSNILSIRFKIHTDYFNEKIKVKNTGALCNQCS